MNEAAAARAQGNCLAQGQALNEAEAAIKAYTESEGFDDVNLGFMVRTRYLGIMNDRLKAERDTPCGDVDSRSDAVMADVPSDTLPGMHETQQVDPTEVVVNPLGLAGITVTLDPPGLDYKSIVDDYLKACESPSVSGNVLQEKTATAEQALADAKLSGRASADQLLALENSMRLSELLEGRLEQNPPACPMSPDQVSEIALQALQIHNSERALVGAPPLIWSPTLTGHAGDHSADMAQQGRLFHSSREGRGTERENLQQGYPDWSVQQLIDEWLKEKSDFKPGVFPDVSVTGDWNAVSHLAQMLWYDTTYLGCNQTQSKGFIWYVCRYDPGGNKDGQWVGLWPTVEQQEQQDAPATQPPAVSIIYFDWDRDELTPQAAAQLDRVADDYARTGRAEAELHGPVEETANPGLNERRLNNVEIYLEGRGVPAAAISSGAVTVKVGP